MISRRQWNPAQRVIRPQDFHLRSIDIRIPVSPSFENLLRAGAALLEECRISSMADSNGWTASAVSVQIDGRIATLSLNRPQKSNALDKAAFKEIPSVRPHASENSGINCGCNAVVWALAIAQKMLMTALKTFLAYFAGTRVDSTSR